MCFQINVFIIHLTIKNESKKRILFTIHDLRFAFRISRNLIFNSLKSQPIENETRIKLFVTYDPIILQTFYRIILSIKEYSNEKSSSLVSPSSDPRPAN